MPDVLVADGAAWFTIPAVVGTIFFLLRVVFLFVGGDAGDLDVDLDHGDPTEAFKILSVQSIAAFMMGFGWGGIAGLRAFGWEWMPSMLIGLAIGGAMVWVLALLLKIVHDLQASGNVRLEHAVGAEGTAYTSIPAGGAGRGQVQVIVDGRQRIYSAVAQGEAIASQARVRVLKVNEDRTLIVDRA